MTLAEPRQIDLEDAIAEAKARDVAPTMRQLREAERERLQKLSLEIEKIIEAARDKASPLRAELSVRTGKRLVSTIFRRAKALATVAEPQLSIATRQDLAGEEPHSEVAYENGTATGIKHRWLWPVEQMRRRDLLTIPQIVAADRFRRAFNDQQRMPKPTTYNDDDSRARGDPSRRDGLTPANHARQAKALALAGGEVGLVWKHLEPEERAVAWGLILEEPFPQNEAPMSVVAFGRAVTHSSTDEHARWFAYGELRLTCGAIASIYSHLDRKMQREQSEQKKRIA